MDNKEKAKLKENIQDKLKTIKKDIASYELLTKPVSPDNAIGRLTRMEAINSKSMNEAALKRAQYTLSKLERAFAKIDHPDFGLCRECEEPIPFKRLLIMPESKFCVACFQKISENHFF